MDTWWRAYIHAYDVDLAELALLGGWLLSTALATMAGGIRLALRAKAKGRN